MSKAAQSNSTDMTQDGSNSWKATIALAAGLLIGILTIHYQTTSSLVAIWLRSDTFAHGFFILPISLWLIWDRRKELSHLTPKPEFRALVPLLAAGFLWLLSNLIDVLVVQQLALISMLISGLWVLLGNQVSVGILFPLLFLFFAVPMGEELVPPLIEFTADTTVKLVQLTGIPIYREGTFFSLPSGNWSVVEACSGIRYLIASITLGSLFAYLTYSSYKKRFLFMIAAIVVPIIANSLRAYMIVMLGHYSGMTVAVGADHLLYGWFFFGIVMFILFGIGSIWRDSEIVKPATANNATIQSSSSNPAHLIQAGLISLVVVAAWPLLANSMDQFQPSNPTTPLLAPTGTDTWHKSEKQAWNWEPAVLGADSSIKQFYRKDGTDISLMIWHFASQKQGSELINSQNLMIKRDDTQWRKIGSKKVTATLNSETTVVEQSHIQGGETEMLAWRFYRIGDNYTVNTYIGKLLEAKAQLTFGRRDGAVIVIAAPFEKNTTSNEIQSFLNDMLPQVEQAIDTASGEFR